MALEIILLSKKDKYLTTITPEGEMLDQETVYKRKFSETEKPYPSDSLVKIIYIES